MYGVARSFAQGTLLAHGQSVEADAVTPGIYFGITLLCLHNVRKLVKYGSYQVPFWN